MTLHSKSKFSDEDLEIGRLSWVNRVGTTQSQGSDERGGWKDGVTVLALKMEGEKTMQLSEAQKLKWCFLSRL